MRHPLQGALNKFRFLTMSSLPMVNHLWRNFMIILQIYLLLLKKHLDLAKLGDMETNDLKLKILFWIFISSTLKCALQQKPSTFVEDDIGVKIDKPKCVFNWCF